MSLNGQPITSTKVSDMRIAIVKEICDMRDKEICDMREGGSYGPYNGHNSSQNKGSRRLREPSIGPSCCLKSLTL